MKEVTFGGDGDFSWERYDERYNVDLANNLGNLVSRVASMAASLSRQVGLRRPARRPISSRGSPSRWWPTIARAMDALRAARGRGRRRSASSTRPTSSSPRPTPWTLAKDPAQADRLGAGALRRGGSDPARGGAARAGDALVVPRDPAPRRRGYPTALHLDRDGRWRNDGERVLLQEGPLWPRIEPTSRGRETAERATIA